jgi:hypothetical protein
MIEDNVKDHIRTLYCENTSADALRMFTCTCCGEESQQFNRQDISRKDFDLDLLQCPDQHQLVSGLVRDESWLPEGCNPDFVGSCLDLADYLLKARGVLNSVRGEFEFAMCSDCVTTLK